ncbi:DUF2894 domain-containing protein [Variovorax sp. HJSM1_2]|uniref:DUF2894 domain-containing protein n=1 Tax=Variovorax sp. HJSM1_2 TaxID=3366263 RepID=UPI003BDAF239
MNETGVDQPLPAWQAVLDGLRADGAQRMDPVRFHFVEVLAQRLPAAQSALQPILQRKLQTAMAGLRERLDQGLQTRRSAEPLAPAAPTPLAGLNHYIQQATQHEPQQALRGRAGRELKSVRRFRETWSKIAAVQQVDRALVRAPENAGPLNSHMLVLHSLAQMRGLSPDYLQRFMSHVDTLLWLDQAQQKPAPAEVKPAARKSRAKK